VSNRIRVMRARPQEMSPEEKQAIQYLLTGQNTNLTDDMTGSFEDYLKGPSMASVLLRSAKGDYLRQVQQQMLAEGTSPSPMIDSITQLDRQ
jgi:hypothetical protein